MAPKPKKRKRLHDGAKANTKKCNFEGKVTKKPKLNSGNVEGKVTKKPFKVATKDFKPKVKKDETPVNKKQQRIRSKELAEARKMKRKKHYTLEQELAMLWEKMRRRNISKADRSMLVSEALKKMKGKISEIACSHVSSRVLQASKKQLTEFISSLHSHVESLLRHMVGSLVIEQAYNLGNATQKQALLSELYSPELQLFKDMVTMKETGLLDVVSKLQLKKSSVVRHMTSVFQPTMEKGIIDHSIVHKAFIEYLTIADKTSAADVLQQLSGLDLVWMIYTKDGSRLGILCIKHGSAKERKKIIKGLKGHVDKIARDKFGANVSLSFSIPSLSNKAELDDNEAAEKEKKDEADGSDLIIQLNEGGKKDPFKRRQEFIDSGLAEKLVDLCSEMAGDMIKSKSGKDVIYEVASGGADKILHPALDEKLGILYESIASLATEPKQEETEEHILEQFHSSRAIIKLILDCPSFASVLWEKALKGKCATWVKGHSSKIIKAFLENSDSTVKELAKKELQPLIEKGEFSLT